MKSPDCSSNRRCLVSTSVVEIYAISVLASLVYSLVNPDMWRSPHIEQWFGWAHSPWSSFLFFASISTLLAIPLTGLSLILDTVLPKNARSLFPVTLRGRGVPFLVGAVARVLVAILVIGLFCIWLADA